MSKQKRMSAKEVKEAERQAVLDGILQTKADNTKNKDEERENRAASRAGSVSATPTATPKKGDKSGAEETKDKTKGALEESEEEEVGGMTEVQTGCPITEDNIKRVQSKLNKYTDLFNFTGIPELKTLTLRKVVIEIELLIHSSLVSINTSKGDGEAPATFDEVLNAWGRMSPGGRDGVSEEELKLSDELLAPVLDHLQKNDTKGLLAILCHCLNQMDSIADDVIARCSKIYPKLACGARTGQLFFRALTYNMKRASALSPAARQVLDNRMAKKQAQSFTITDIDFAKPEDINRETLRDGLWNRFGINMTGFNAHIYEHVNEPAYTVGGDLKYDPIWDSTAPSRPIVSGHKGIFQAIPNASFIEYMDNIDFETFSITGNKKWSARHHITVGSKGKEMELRTRGEDIFTYKFLFCELVGAEHWGRWTHHLLANSEPQLRVTDADGGEVSVVTGATTKEAFWIRGSNSSLPNYNLNLDSRYAIISFIVNTMEHKTALLKETKSIVLCDRWSPGPNQNLSFFVGQMSIYYPKPQGAGAGSYTPAPSATMLGKAVPTITLTGIPEDVWEMLKVYGTYTRNKRDLLTQEWLEDRFEQHGVFEFDYALEDRPSLTPAGKKEQILQSITLRFITAVEADFYEPNSTDPAKPDMNLIPTHSEYGQPDWSSLVVTREVITGIRQAAIQAQRAQASPFYTQQQQQQSTPGPAPWSSQPNQPPQLQNFQQPQIAAPASQPPLDLAALLNGFAAAQSVTTKALIDAMTVNMDRQHDKLMEVLKGTRQGGERDNEYQGAGDNDTGFHDFDQDSEDKRNFFFTPGFTEDERDELSAGIFTANNKRHAKAALVEALSSLSEITVHLPMYFDRDNIDQRSWIAFAKRPRDTSYVGSVTGSPVFQEGIQGWGVIIDLIEDRVIEVHYNVDEDEYVITACREKRPKSKDAIKNPLGNGGSSTLSRVWRRD